MRLLSYSRLSLSPGLSNDVESFKHDSCHLSGKFDYSQYLGLVFSGDLSDIIQIVSHSDLRMKEEEINSLLVSRMLKQAQNTFNRWTMSSEKFKSPLNELLQVKKNL